MSGFTPVALGTAQLLLPMALRAVAWVHLEEERQRSLALAAEKCATTVKGSDLATAARIAARVAGRASYEIPAVNPEPYEAALMASEAAYLAARAVQNTDELGVGGAELAGDATLAIIDAVKEAAGEEAGELVREVASQMALGSMATIFEGFEGLEDFGLGLEDPS